MRAPSARSPAGCGYFEGSETAARWNAVFVLDHSQATQAARRMCNFGQLIGGKFPVPKRSEISRNPRVLSMGDFKFVIWQFESCQGSHVTNHYKTFRFHNNIDKSFASGGANSKYSVIETIQVLVRVQKGGLRFSMRLLTISSYLLLAFPYRIGPGANCLNVFKHLVRRPITAILVVQDNYSISASLHSQSTMVESSIYTAAKPIGGASARQSLMATPTLAQSIQIGKRSAICRPGTASY